MDKTSTFAKNALQNYETPYSITIQVDSELHNLLQSMEETKEKLTNEHLDSLADNCLNVVIDSLLGPFGLSRSMFTDKDGGNVTTIHNASRTDENGKNIGVFANEADRQRYNRDYDFDAYHDKNDKYAVKKKVLSEQANQGTLRDVYNSKRGLFATQADVDPNRIAKRESGFDTEHVIAAKRIHDDPRAKLFMDEKQSADLANHDANLGATNSSLNSSKRDKKLSEWMNSQSSHDPTVKNAEAYGVNRKEADDAERKASRTIDWELTKAGAKTYSKELMVTGTREGLTMGARQAVGMLLKELVEAVFFEIRDFARHGNSEHDSLGQALRIRLERVAQRVLAKWKDALIGFKDGAIKAFVSNLITFLINTLVTTFKRAVTIIREGFHSLLQAIKLLVNPPEDMTKGEAIFQATKILSAATLTIIGLFLEETVQKFLETIPFLVPFAADLAPVVVGMFTGIATVLVVYLFDQLKSKIELRHQQHVFVESGVLVNQYKALETLSVLDKSIYFTNQMHAFLEEEINEFNHTLERNTRQDKQGEQEFHQLLNQLKAINNTL